MKERAAGQFVPLPIYTDIKAWKGGIGARISAWFRFWNREDRREKLEAKFWEFRRKFWSETKIWT